MNSVARLAMKIKNRFHKAHSQSKVAMKGKVAVNWQVVFHVEIIGNIDGMIMSHLCHWVVGVVERVDETYSV